MSFLPDVSGEQGLSPRDLRSAGREFGRAQMRVHRAFLSAGVKTQIDAIDSQAVADALKTSLECEVDLYQEGVRMANGSQVVLELLARKLEIANGIDNVRIQRRFGA